MQQIFPASRPIVIVPYDPEWPGEFTALRLRIQAVLGPIALRVDHIGSTAIPGLPAKDIIDIQITLADLDDPVLQPAMLEAGFSAKPDVRWDSYVGLPEHSPELCKRYFREGAGERRTHIHVRQLGRFNQRYSLLFRDYLRAMPAVRDTYAVIKERLAQLFPESIEGYLFIKDPVMDCIFAAAESWAATSGWDIKTPPGLTDLNEQ